MLGYHTSDKDRLATLELGGPASNVFFVQHGAYAAQAQQLLGKAVVDANYPMDNTHTAPFLADVVSAPQGTDKPTNHN